MSRDNCMGSCLECGEDIGNNKYRHRHHCTYSPAYQQERRYQLLQAAAVIYAGPDGIDIDSAIDDAEEMLQSIEAGQTAEDAV